ncbi:hypothetical protein MPLSOD_30125 [Mesorhizobium sp. SOD10]|nr:hypothetical protein MPLSOD_30125 [Mesorhizobium sp. SOD10]
MLGAVECRLGGGRGLEQVLLTLEGRLVVGNVGLGLFDHRQRLLIASLQRQHLVAHRAELRLGAGERGFEGGRPQAEEHVALLHRLVVVHFDLLDGAGDVGGNAERLRLDIGVVGGHDLAADDIVVTAGHQCQGQQREQDRPRQAAARLGGSGRSHGDGSRLRLGRGRLQRCRLRRHGRFQIVVFDDRRIIAAPLLALAVQANDLVAYSFTDIFRVGGLSG